MSDAEIVALDDRLQALSVRVAELESASEPEAIETEPVEFDRAGLHAWVDHTLCPMLTELTHPTEWPAWCVDWHLHPLAVHLFETLYLGWLEIDDAASRMAWTDHLFLHTRDLIISPETGPFQLCTEGHHSRRRTRTEPAPRPSHPTPTMDTRSARNEVETP